KPTVTLLTFLSSSSLRFWSWEHRDHCRNWYEIAAVIRFDLVCPHAINSPGSRSDTSRHAVVCCKPCLPIQGNTGILTPCGRKADIEKCFASEIDTRKVGRIRGACRNKRPVESQTGNHQRDRHLAAKRIVERPVGIITG